MYKLYDSKKPCEGNEIYMRYDYVSIIVVQT